MTVQTDPHTLDAAGDGKADEVLLSTEDLVVGYSGVPVVSGVDLTLKRGEIVALEIATRAYVVATGQVKLSGDAADLRGRPEEIEALYLSG